MTKPLNVSTPSGPTVAVVVPCLNEAHSIAKVVADFRASLPDARIVVVDNASTDGTAEIAFAAGAEVVRETRRGKGFALLTGLRHAAPADIFVMVDGDGTYPAESAPLFVARIQAGADMVIGTRLEGAGEGAFPVGHSWGNRLFNTVVRLLFGIRTLDLFSGYRALTSRLLEQSPLIAKGFEIETELSIQAFVNHFRVDEVPVTYRARTGDSKSKLRTVGDGSRILLAIFAFFRDYRPLTSFGAAALLLLVASLSAGGLVIQQYVETGQVLRVPLAICAAGLFILSALSMTAGVVLSSINRRAEEIRALLVSKGRAS
ncbi:MAG TPA: glycosyltransferase [Vicinamibacterales bacterium]|nr:glycosyltransferase [Vicinamibacterales bacterium]